MADAVVLLEVEPEPLPGPEDGAGAADGGGVEGAVALGEEEAARALDGLDVGGDLDGGRVERDEGVGVAAAGEEDGVAAAPAVAMNGEAGDAVLRAESVADFVHERNGHRVAVATYPGDDARNSAAEGKALHTVPQAARGRSDHKIDGVLGNRISVVKIGNKNSVTPILGHAVRYEPYVRKLCSETDKKGMSLISDNIR